MVLSNYHSLLKFYKHKELEIIWRKRPDLKLLEFPKKPHLKFLPSEPVLNSVEKVNKLDTPTVDQIILKFLEQYEVFIEPRSVGEWNGWDTISAIGLIFSGEGNSRNIASTIFAANRSNQISDAAEDWGNWKRWAIDHPDFEEFKSNIILETKKYNKRLLTLSK